MKTRRLSPLWWRATALIACTVELTSLAAASEGAQEQHAVGAVQDVAVAGASATAGSVGRGPSWGVYRLLVNGMDAGNWPVLTSDGKYWATREALTAARVVQSPSMAMREWRGRAWFALSDLEGFRSAFSIVDQTLVIDVEPSVLEATVIAEEQAPRKQAQEVLGSLALNYDLAIVRNWYRGWRQFDSVGLQGEVVATAPLAVLSSSFVVQKDPLLGLDGGRSEDVHWRRLQTTVTKNFESQGFSLRIGDSVTTNSGFVRAVGFGGLQVGRDWSLSPGMRTEPMPVVRGNATVPSAVDLYVNDVLRQTTQIPSGPFAIDAGSGFAANGDIRVVLRDNLGRQTVVELPLASYPGMLEEGLDDWAVQVGAVRQNLGLADADYGPLFASGSWRRGLTKWMTLESHLQWSRDLREAGGSAVLSLPGPMQLTLGAAGSLDDGRRLGGSLNAVLSHESQRQAVRMQATRSSLAYRQIGDSGAGLRTQAALSYSRTLGGAADGRQPSSSNWALGAALVHTQSWQQPSTIVGSLGLTGVLGGRATVSLQLSRVLGATAATAFNAVWMLPLEEGMTSSVSVSRFAGTSALTATVSQGLSADGDGAWRLSGGRRLGGQFAEAGYYRAADAALLTTDVSLASGQQAIRLGAQGSIGVAGGSLYASRTLRDSFALVEVPGHSGVGILLNGNRVGITDGNGRALVPGLQPYMDNYLKLDPNSLPIGADIDSIERVAVPAWRSGVKVEFPIRTGIAVLVHLVLPDGSDVPNGAGVAVERGSAVDGERFYVARRGKLFLGGVDGRPLRLSVDLGSSSCVATVQLDPAMASFDKIARVGPVPCN